MKTIILLILLMTVLISGCVSQKEYVCSDGTVVSEPSLCQTTTTSIMTTTTTITTTTTTTTTPIVLVTTVSGGECNPCFNYFAYFNHNNTFLTIQNGKYQISINNVTFGQFKRINILHGCTQFPCNVKIYYAISNVTYSDTATLK
jgi:hypothetical protein